MRFLLVSSLCYSYAGSMVISFIEIAFVKLSLNGAYLS
jgi:hypothetical protein